MNIVYNIVQGVEGDARNRCARLVKDARESCTSISHMGEIDLQVGIKVDVGHVARFQPYGYASEDGVLQWTICGRSFGDVTKMV